MADKIKALSEVFRLLGEPNRLRILLSLGLECRPVSAVIAATGLSQTNVSFHLRTLREAGLVRGEPNGPFVFYCLADPTLRTWDGGRRGIRPRPTRPSRTQRVGPRAATPGQRLRALISAPDMN